MTNEPLSLCIVGLGPRGLSVLERIVAFAKRNPQRVVVNIIEPNEQLGSGLHDVRQPDYWLLNTVCGELTMFPDERMIGPEGKWPGPTLFEWCVRQGVHFKRYTDLDDDGSGVEIRPSDHLPRRLLGEYLRWFYATLLVEAPAHLVVRVHRTSVASITPGMNGGENVVLETGLSIDVDVVFLTTGHTGNDMNRYPRAQPRWISNIYEQRNLAALVQPADIVGVSGFGLAAMDVLAEFTLGRGGRFRRGRRARLVYEASGREPHILLFSRTGLPYRARPDISKGTLPLMPLVFTEESIDALRLSKATAGGLDFFEDVVPLIELEMLARYFQAQALLLEGECGMKSVRTSLDEAWRSQRVHLLVHELAARYGNFDPHRLLFQQCGGLASASEYEKAVVHCIDADLVEADKGIIGSPIKCALEMLRSQRDVIRYAVNFGSLSTRSYVTFYQEATQLINRMVIGPQRERNKELLALVQAGIVRLAVGPNPVVEWADQNGTWRISSRTLQTPVSVCLDWLCSGYSELPSATRSRSPLVRQLYADGRIRPRHDGVATEGAEVDARHNPISNSGVPQRRLFVLGSLGEGSTYFNHYVPSPDVPSRSYLDAHAAVATGFSEIGGLPR